MKVWQDTGMASHHLEQWWSCSSKGIFGEHREHEHQVAQRFLSLRTRLSYRCLHFERAANKNGNLKLQDWNAEMVELPTAKEGSNGQCPSQSSLWHLSKGNTTYKYKAPIVLFQHSWFSRLSEMKRDLRDPFLCLQCLKCFKRGLGFLMSLLNTTTSGKYQVQFTKQTFSSSSELYKDT